MCMYESLVSPPPKKIIIVYRTFGMLIAKAKDFIRPLRGADEEGLDRPPGVLRVQAGPLV